MKTPIQNHLIPLVMAITAVGVTGVCAEEKVTPIDLGKVQLGPQAQLVDEGGQPLLRVEETAGKKPQEIHLFDIDKPVITQDAYALTGEVRYKNVAGRAYLETWNHFVLKDGDKPFPAKFFTRTLNPTGSMGVISTNSDWRPFQLPFFINTDNASSEGPVKITFNLHLDGGGLVEIRNVELVDALREDAVFHSSSFPGAVKIFVIMFVIIAIMAVVTRLIASPLRSKKRTAEELSRSRASDV